MPLEMQGADDLRDDLTNMAANLEFGAGVNRALEAGAAAPRQPTARPPQSPAVK